MVDTSEEFLSRVIDISECSRPVKASLTSVIDIGEEFLTSVNNTSKESLTIVVDTGEALELLNL